VRPGARAGERDDGLTGDGAETGEVT